MIFIFSDSLHEFYFLDYINSLLANYPEEITYINDKICFQYNSDDIFVFMQKVPDYFDPIQIPNKIYVLNTEQMSNPDIRREIEQISEEIEIIDYSQTNIRHLLEIKKKAHYLPYMVNRSEILDLPKTKDVAIIGWWDSSYRMNILSDLAQIGIDCNQIVGFDRDRDDELFRHRILVNIHFNECSRIFEQMRCNRCILNRMIVISEKSDDIDYELRSYMIECEYSEIAEKTRDVLANYDAYHKKLFENFDLDMIERNYKTIADKFIYMVK